MQLVGYIAGYTSILQLANEYPALIKSRGINHIWLTGAYIKLLVGRCVLVVRIGIK